MDRKEIIKKRLLNAKNKGMKFKALTAYNESDYMFYNEICDELKMAIISVRNSWMKGRCYITIKLVEDEESLSFTDFSKSGSGQIVLHYC